MNTYTLYGNQAELIRQMYKDSDFTSLYLTKDELDLLRTFAYLAYLPEHTGKNPTPYHYGEGHKEILNTIRDKWITHIGIQADGGFAGL